MNKMFYVLYSPERNLYLDEDFDVTYYKHAARHPMPNENMLRNAQLYVPDARWVGPCTENEEP